MKEAARKIWNSPQGVALLDKMLSGTQPAAQDKATLAELKRADPPSTAQPKKG